MAVSGCLSTRAPEKFHLGDGEPLEPLFLPPPPPGGGSKSRLSFFHVSCIFHDKTTGTVTVCHSTLTVTITVSLQGGGGSPMVVSRSNTSFSPPKASWSQKFQTFVLRK